MPNWLSDTLFGSGGELETQTLSTLTPEQEAVMRRLFDSLGGGDLSGSFIDPREETSLEALEQRALNREAGDAEADAALREIVMNRGAPGGANGFEEFFRTNVQDPAVENFNTTVRPQIGRDFGGSSFFSSERANADRMAGDELIQSLTKSRADLQFKERTGNADRLMAALGLRPQISSTNTSTALGELEAFGTPRRARDDRVRQLIEALSVRGRENLGGMTEGTTGLVQSFLGGGGGDVLGGLLSDRRMKKNLRPIGKTEKGITIYTYNYIFDDVTTHIGVMADDVEHIPGAVTIVGGIKYVDYSKVT